MDWLAVEGTEEEEEERVDDEVEEVEVDDEVEEEEVEEDNSCLSVVWVD
jgi:hypothetical protein